MNPENNKIDGLVAVGLDLSWLGKWVQNLNMSRDYTFTLLDSEGFVLARYPNDGFAAEKINESEIYENIMMAKSANKNEAIFEASGLNGQKRLFAFADIPNPQAPRTLLDLYLVVGQAIEE
ncbi:MAG: hypothetical protein HYT12_02805 [Candidatus Liptonbacteria bacterium]|nr:hypothetical protein [Candidatus Liptonbacteria bacterium]